MTARERDRTEARSVAAVVPLEVGRADGGLTRGEVRRPDARRRVVLLHGMGQTRHAWGPTASVLAEQGFSVCTYDLRGHGDSDWARSSSSGYTLDELVADLDGVLDAVGRPAAVVGSSIGGLVGLLAEARRPSCWALVLVDITPRVEQEGSERIRSFMQGSLDGFDSLDEAAAAIAAYQGRQRPPGSTSGLSRVLRRDDEGRYRWHWDPRLVERPPMDSVAPGAIDRAAQALRIPVLALRGARSDVVSAAGVEEFRALAPHAVFKDVARAGHTIAGDRNDVFTAEVLAFLASVEDGT